jgi:hypothetical protein
VIIALNLFFYQQQYYTPKFRKWYATATMLEGQRQFPPSSSNFSCSLIHCYLLISQTVNYLHHSVFFLFTFRSWSINNSESVTVYRLSTFLGSTHVLIKYWKKHVHIQRPWGLKLQKKIQFKKNWKNPALIIPRTAIIFPLDFRIRQMNYDVITF